MALVWILPLSSAPSVILEAVTYTRSKSCLSSVLITGYTITVSAISFSPAPVSFLVTGSQLQLLIPSVVNRSKLAASLFWPFFSASSVLDSTKFQPVAYSHFTASAIFSRTSAPTQPPSSSLVRSSRPDTAQLHTELALRLGRSVLSSLKPCWDLWEIEEEPTHGWIMSWRFSPSLCLSSISSFYWQFRLVGVFTSLLIPETKRKTLEELTGEDHWLNNETPGNGTHSGNISGSNSVDKNEKAVWLFEMCVGGCNFCSL